MSAVADAICWLSPTRYVGLRQRDMLAYANVIRFPQENALVNTRPPYCAADGTMWASSPTVHGWQLGGIAKKNVVALPPRATHDSRPPLQGRFKGG